MFSLSGPLLNWGKEKAANPPEEIQDAKYEVKGHASHTIARHVTGAGACAQTATLAGLLAERLLTGGTGGR